MDLHAHITVPFTLPHIPHGWKATDIVLENETRTQVDMMYTKHYRIGVRGIQNFQDIIDDAKDVFRHWAIKRLKVEQDSEFFLPVNKENYLEIHMLVPDGIPILEGWVKSRNPKSIVNGQRRFFMNKRVYASKLMADEAAHNIRKKVIAAKIPFIEFKAEQIIFDSNRALDGWWA